jgi:hypothetical protein
VKVLTSQIRFRRYRHALPAPLRTSETAVLSSWPLRPFRQHRAAPTPAISLRGRDSRELASPFTRRRVEADYRFGELRRLATALSQRHVRREVARYE